MQDTIEMRAVLGQELSRLMEQNPQICVIDADLGKANGTVGIREKFPDRALDVGVAEQNMASVAAGLASYGFIPFISSFTPFASRRICDQIAISICYANQNVKIVGSDPGISAELNGGTHMSMEDIGVLRSIPGIVIFEPVDAIQLRKSLPAIVQHNGPVYIRLFRKAAPVVFGEEYQFNLFEADVLRQGKDVSIFASGIMVAEALKAAQELKVQGIQAEVINIHTIKPIDGKAIEKSINKTGCAVTCENHNTVGGLYAAVSEAVAATTPVPIEAVGIKDVFGEVGFMPYLRDKFGLNAADIVVACKKSIARKK